MNLVSALASRLIDSFVEPLPDNEIRALGIQANAGVVGAITNPLQPVRHHHQVRVPVEKAWDEDDRGSVTMGDANAVVHRRSDKQQKLNAKERFVPLGELRLGW